EREGGNIGQVDFGRAGIQLNQAVAVGGVRNLSDDRVDFVIAISTPVAIPVAARSSELGAHQLANTAPWVGRASAIGPEHEDVIFGLLAFRRDGLVNGPLGEEGGDFNTNLGASGSHNFDSSLPVGPAIGAGGVEGKVLAIQFADAVTVGINDASVVEELVGAFDIIADPLQILDSVMVVEGLLTGGRVHHGAWNLREGWGLVGHRVGDDGVIVHRDGNGLADGDILQRGD